MKKPASSRIAADELILTYFVVSIFFCNVKVAIFSDKVLQIIVFGKMQKEMDTMKIAIIGTGNIGGTLAKKWADKGHSIYLGVRDKNSFRGQELLKEEGITLHLIPEAVQMAEIILIAVPATAAAETAKLLDNTAGKIIIDTMNVVRGRGPEGFSNTSDAILANTMGAEVVKCFNSTGYNNIINPVYNGIAIDMFMAGGSKEAKEKVRQLALDAGFAECYDFGGREEYELLEKFANAWINLAMFRGMGREIGFKLLKR